MLAHGAPGGPCALDPASGLETFVLDLDEAEARAGEGLTLTDGLGPTRAPATGALRLVGAPLPNAGIIGVRSPI